MDEKTKLLENIKLSVLAEAISAIDIEDVVIRHTDESNIHLRIKTRNLGTVDSEKLSSICSKYSTDKIFVTFQIPTDHVIEDPANLGYSKHIPNTDLVCIFIEGETKFDPSSFILFG